MLDTLWHCLASVPGQVSPPGKELQDEKFAVTTHSQVYTKSNTSHGTETDSQQSGRWDRIGLPIPPLDWTGQDACCSLVYSYEAET